MKLARFAIAALLLGTLFVCACNTAPTSSESAATAVKKKDPIPMSGKTCLNMMSDAAQRWESDALPFQLESEVNTEGNGQDGRSTVWHGTFASPSTRNLKEFACSGSRLKESPAVGVTSTAEASYPPSVNSAMFQPFLLASDSDVAAKTAKDHGGADILAKAPTQPIVYSLNWDAKSKKLYWFVVYGTSARGAKGVAVVDAANGAWVGVKK